MTAPNDTVAPRVTSFSPAAQHPTMIKLGNRVMRPVLRSRLGARMHELALLTVTGRRTGRRYEIPVALYDLDGRPVVLTAGRWLRNLRGGADVALTHDGETRMMHAEVDEDPEVVADVYGAMLARVGVRHANRVGLRVTGDEMPTHEELVRAVGGERAVVHLSAA